MVNNTQHVQLELSAGSHANLVLFRPIFRFYHLSKHDEERRGRRGRRREERGGGLREDRRLISVGAPATAIIILRPSDQIVARGEGGSRKSFYYVLTSRL